MPPAFLELAIILVAATLMGIVARILRQPTIVAFLATGLLLGIAIIPHFREVPVFKLFSELGIMLVLFHVGLEMSPASFRLIGKPAILLGAGQIAITASIGYWLARLLHFAPLPSFYLALALTFSSTVIVVKLLADKRDLQSLYGRMSLGILITQDIAAIILLLIVSGFGNTLHAAATDALWSIALGGATAFLLYLIGRRVVSAFLADIARDSDLLFLAPLAWLFFTASIFMYAGLSLPVAGFVAGLSLASASTEFGFARRLRPLRDFFVLVFFVLLGASLSFANLDGLWVPLALFSLYVIIGNPLIMLILMGLMSYRKRAGFMTGVAIAQISEFSFILMALGASLGHIGAPIVSLVTAIGAVTIAVSCYTIRHAETLYTKLAPLLSVFERRIARNPAGATLLPAKPIILIGFQRTGQSIALHLPMKDLLVVDFDPATAELLKEQGYDHLFGDVRDPGIVEEMRLADARLLISTCPDAEDNRALLAAIRHLKKKPKTILRAETEADAHLLYREGADFVLLPNMATGHALGKMLARSRALTFLPELRKRDMKFFSSA